MWTLELRKKQLWWHLRSVQWTHDCYNDAQAHTHEQHISVHSRCFHKFEKNLFARAWRITPALLCTLPRTHIVCPALIFCLFIPLSLSLSPSFWKNTFGSRPSIHPSPRCHASWAAAIYTSVLLMTLVCLWWMRLVKCVFILFQLRLSFTDHLRTDGWSDKKNEKW